MTLGNEHERDNSVWMASDLERRNKANNACTYHSNMCFRHYLIRFSLESAGNEDCEGQIAIVCFCWFVGLFGGFLALVFRTQNNAPTALLFCCLLVDLILCLPLL